ncbi:hemagglutinin [Parashewanella curva]|uniref:Hemagglutinin n=2 Tax=Parashewanella curva TaxID=2338552 RepID=A0A3L8PSA4_9GAMM|nr:hemagglutinin [Parashewanella curva]
MADLSNAKCPCRGCDQVATDEKSVEELFGIRNMGDGIVRVQSYCRKCRTLHCEASNPKCN